MDHFHSAMDYEILHDHDHHHHNHCMMHTMHFTYTADVGAVLFEFWQVKEVWSLLLTMVVMVVAGVANQFLVWLLKKQLMAGMKGDADHYENMDSGDDALCKKGKNTRVKKYAWMAVKPLIFAVQNTLSYLLMLVVMTFNVWLFAAVVAGNVIGWAIFNMTDGITPDCATCH